MIKNMNGIDYVVLLLEGDQQVTLQRCQELRPRSLSAFQLIDVHLNPGSSRLSSAILKLMVRSHHDRAARLAPDRCSILSSMRHTLSYPEW